MSEIKKIAEYTKEEIEAFGAAKPEDNVDFSYPEGFFRAANSLEFLPDTQTRVQMMTVLMSFIETL